MRYAKYGYSYTPCAIDHVHGYDAANEAPSRTRRLCRTVHFAVLLSTTPFTYHIKQFLHFHIRYCLSVGDDATSPQHMNNTCLVIVMVVDSQEVALSV